jgi:short chain dehydrogenase
LDEINPIEDSATPDKQLAFVTGASTSIGLELAKCAAEVGFDLVIAADEAAIESAAAELRPLAGGVQAVQADLATTENARRQAPFHVPSFYVDPPVGLPGSTGVSLSPSPSGAARLVSKGIAQYKVPEPP